MLRATCSADAHRPDSNNTKDTSVFVGSRRATYLDQKNVCSRQKLPPTCNVRCTQARHEKQRSTKTKENTVNVTILESRDIRQVPTKRRVEAQSQNRDMVIRDVCTCLAHRAPPTLRSLPPFWPSHPSKHSKVGNLFWRGNLFFFGGGRCQNRFLAFRRAP